MFKILKIYCFYLLKAKMDFCCCEKTAKVDETPILLGKKIKCQLCGLQRRSVPALKRDEETEGATAQYMAQSYKSDEKQIIERRKGSAWRVPMTKAHKVTRTQRNCGRCGLQKQQTDCAIEPIRLGRIMHGNFGKHTYGNITRKVREAKMQGSVAPAPTTATAKLVKKSKANKFKNSNTYKSEFECPSAVENNSVPTLTSLAHTALTKRPDIIRMHLPQTQVSDVIFNGEVYCANESLPLRTRVTQSATTGAIRKRHSYMNFSEHKSKPLQPLNKILSDIVTKHSSSGEHFQQETAEHLNEMMYRAAGGFADAADCEALIELPTFEQRTDANSHRDLNLSETDCLATMTTAFYNSNEQQRFSDITSFVSPKWLPYDFTPTTTHESSTCDTDVISTPVRVIPACQTNKCSDAVNAQPIFSVRSLVADQFGNNFPMCNKQLDTGQNSERTTDEIVFESRNNVTAPPTNSHRGDDNGNSNADTEKVNDGEQRYKTDEHTKFRGPLGFRKVHETCAYGNQAQLAQALPKSQQTEKNLKKCVQNAMQKPNGRVSVAKKDGITAQKCQHYKKQPKRQRTISTLLRKAVIAKEKRLCYGTKRLPLVENTLSKETSSQQKNVTIMKRNATKSFALNKAKTQSPIERVENHRQTTKTTQRNEAEKSHMSQANRRNPFNNLQQNRQNTNAKLTKGALETRSKPIKVTQFKNLSPRMKRLIGIQAPQLLERLNSKLQRQNVEIKNDARIVSRILSENQPNNRKTVKPKQNIPRDALAVSALKPNNTKQNPLNNGQQVFRSVKKPLTEPVIEEPEPSQSNMSEHEIIVNFQNRNTEKFLSNDTILKTKGISMPHDDGLQFSAISRHTSKLSLILEEPNVSTQTDYETNRTSMQESPMTSSEPQTDSLLPTIDYYNFSNDSEARSTDSYRSNFRKRLPSGMPIIATKLKYKQIGKKRSLHKLKNTNQCSKNLPEKKLKNVTAEKDFSNENKNKNLQESKPIKNNQSKADSKVLTTLITTQNSNNFLDIRSSSDSFKTLSKSTTTQILEKHNREKSEGSENQNQKALNSNTKKLKKDCLASLKVTKQPLIIKKSFQTAKVLKAPDLINQRTAANLQPTHNQDNFKSFCKTKEFNAYKDELIAHFIPDEKLFKNEVKTDKRCTICASRCDSSSSVQSRKSKPTVKVRNSSRKSKNKTISQNINQKNYIKHLKIKSYKVYRKPTCKSLKSFHEMSTESSQSLTKLTPDEETKRSSSSLLTNDMSLLKLPLLKQPRPYYFEFRMPDVEPSNVMTYMPHSAQPLKSELPDANWFKQYESFTSRDASLKGINSDCDCENSQESQKNDCGAFSMNEYLPIQCNVHNCNTLLMPSSLLAHYAHEHCHWYGAHAKVQCQSIYHGAARHMALNVNQLPLDQIQYVGILAYAGVRGQKSLVERNLCPMSVLLPAFIQELAQSLPVVILACKLSNSVLHRHMSSNKASKSEVTLENPKNQIVAIWAAAYSLPCALQLKMTIYDKQFLCSRMQVMCVRYFHKASQDPYEFVASKKDYLLLTYADLQLLTHDFKADLRLDVVINEL